jgi:hypothetical protein
MISIKTNIKIVIEKEDKANSGISKEIAVLIVLYDKLTNIIKKELPRRIKSKKAGNLFLLLNNLQKNIL